MKKLIISLVFIFAVSAFAANMAFIASNPIPGVDIIVKKNPGGTIVTEATDANGKFSFKLQEGKYDFKMSYDQITRVIRGLNKNHTSNPSDYQINLMLTGQTRNSSIFDRWGNTVQLINKETGIISITVAKGGETIIGTLTCTDVKSPNDRMNQKR